MSQQGQEIEDREILAQLKRWEEVGLLDYVLPTTPLGEAWVVGYKGQILKFTGKEGAVAYLLGLNAGALYMAGKVIPGILATATAEAEGAALHLSEPDTSVSVTAMDSAEFDEFTRKHHIRWEET